MLDPKDRTTQLRTALMIALLGAVLLAGCTAETGGGAASTDDADPAGGDDMMNDGDPAAPAAKTVEAIPLVTHVQFGVIDQDLYLDRGDGQGVWRITVANASDPALQDAPLYTAAEAVPHDPTFQNVGPFPKGQAVNVTMSEWLSARGAFALVCQDGTATVDGRMTNLVPDGVYTVWDARVRLENGAIVAVEDRPLGASDGSQNVFTADEDGNGRFHLDGIPGLDPTEVDAAGNGEATILAVAWHSDGETYGDDPGDFGSVTHVQLFAMIDAARP